MGLVVTQAPIEERTEGSRRYRHVLSMSVQNLGLFHFSFSLLYGAGALRRPLSCLSNSEKQTPVFNICWKAVVLHPTPHHQKLWRWWAKNLINREAGLIGTELQPAAVVPRPRLQGPGAERALNTQCRATKCSISSAFVYLNITLCCRSPAQSFLLGVVLFLTRHKGTWTSEEVNKGLSVDAESVHRVAGFGSVFHFVLRFPIRYEPVLEHKVNLRACILNAFKVSSVLLIPLPL